MRRGLKVHFSRVEVSQLSQCPPLHHTQRPSGRMSSSSTPSGVHARDLSIVPASVPPRPTTAWARGRDHISQNLMLSLLRQGLSMPIIYKRSATLRTLAHAPTGAVRRLCNSSCWGEVGQCRMPRSHVVWPFVSTSAHVSSSPSFPRSPSLQSSTRQLYQRLATLDFNGSGGLPVSTFMVRV